jgi:hypothetical protein
VLALATIVQQRPASQEREREIARRWNIERTIRYNMFPLGRPGPLLMLEGEHERANCHRGRRLGGAMCSVPIRRPLAGCKELARDGWKWEQVCGGGRKMMRYCTINHIMDKCNTMMKSLSSFWELSWWCCLFFFFFFYRLFNIVTIILILIKKGAVICCKTALQVVSTMEGPGSAIYYGAVYDENFEVWALLPQQVVALRTDPHLALHLCW